MLRSIDHRITQIEKVVTKLNTSTTDGQKEFKQRYFDLCDELGDFIADQRQADKNASEFKVGGLVVQIDKKDRCVLDIIRANKGLPRRRNNNNGE